MKYLFLALALAVSGCSCETIEPGHVGVIVHLTGDDKGGMEVVSNGRYYPGVNTKIYVFPTYNQQHVWTNNEHEGKINVDERLYFTDKSGLRLGADVGIQFNVPAANVEHLFVTYRQDLDSIRDTVIKMSVRDSLNAVAQDYTAEDIFGEHKTRFFAATLKRVQEQMAPSGIVVSNLYLSGELELPKQIHDTIQAKLAATMQAQQKENEKRTVEAEAAKVVAQATGEAQAAKTRAEGAAAAQVATAEGQAKTNIATAKGEAEALVAAAKGRADALLLEATAQAQANQKLSNSLTPQILELKKLEIQAGVQKAYADKWGGGVPTTILPGQVGGQFLDIRGGMNNATTK